MPLGRAVPVEELGLVAQWIRNGASVACDELPPAEIPYDPNALDHNELFTCADSAAPRASPSRIRRIGSAEFTAVAVNAAGASQNPLAGPAGRFSTYPDGLSLDPTTLNLYMGHLPYATDYWSMADPAGSPVSRVSRRMDGLYVSRSDVIACMEARAPEDGCIDTWVRTVLERGALFRDPEEEELASLRAYLMDRIASETADGASRQRSLHETAQAALLMAGSLFRSDLGEPNSSGALRELSDAELGQALAGVLGPAPMGTPLPLSTHEDHPDATRSAEGSYAFIRRAATDGTIRDPSVRRTLFRRYASGVSGRADVSIAITGSRWIAPRIRDFFREWLGYAGASSAFKDTPQATSAYDSDEHGLRATVTRSYSSLQSPANHSALHEPGMVQQLDATIARAVIESDESGEDVFRSLMTTRRWYLSSDVAVNGNPCTADDECDHGCDERTGTCWSSVSLNWRGVNWAAGHESPVPTDEPSRWVTLPEGGSRAGVLTHPAWLAAHGGNFEDDASLIERGHWLRTQLFCQQVGGLDNVQGLEAMLVARDLDLSARNRVRWSTEPGVDPEGDDETTGQCYGCHQDMNTLGFPFEAFNHAGFERARDHGGPPDSSTVVDNLPDPALNRSYRTVREFVEALGASRYARRGMVRQAFRFFMGRDEVLADGCTLVEMDASLEETGSFLAMMEALIASETFTRRYVEASTEGEES